MSFLSPIKTPTRWSELQESQVAGVDDIDDILNLSLIPEPARDTFKENVSSVEEFTATDEDAATLIVDALSTEHPDLFRSPVKQRLCVNNLVLLAQFKQAGGSATACPSIAEIKAFVEASKMPQTGNQRFSPSPTPDQSSPDSKQVNGMKLALAIPVYKGEEEKWFDWRAIVLMKIGQFPAFGKVFQDEAEALKDTVTSEVLYNIFKEKTFGGAAHTLVESVTPKTGFHAFQALSEAMEGTEVSERLQAQADLLEATAKKDSSKSFLEFQGDMLKYLDVLDKVEALEKRPKVSEEKKIRTILKAITDGAYKETVLRLHGEIRKKNITTSQELFSELRKVETNVLTGDFDDAKKPAATL
jgi:hypothetical protein